MTGKKFGSWAAVLLAMVLVRHAHGADLLVGGRITSTLTSHLYYPDDIVIWVGTCPLGTGDDPAAKYAETMPLEAEYEIVDWRDVNGSVLACGYSTNGIVGVTIRKNVTLTSETGGTVSVAAFGRCRHRPSQNEDGHDRHSGVMQRHVAQTRQ